MGISFTCFNPLINICINDGYPEYAAHGGLNHFRIIQFSRFFTAHYLADPKPIGRTDDRTHVSRILNIIKYKGDPVSEVRHRWLIRFLHQRQYLVGGTESGDFFQLNFRNS